MKKLTAFLCALFLLGNGMTPALSAFAEVVLDDPALETTEEITVDGLTFTIHSYSGSAVLTGCTSNAAEIVIPSEIEGRPVTEIGENAFAGLTTLTSVLIPESIDTVSTTAFDGTSLKKVFLESDLNANFPYGVDVYPYYHIPLDTAEYTVEFQNSMSYRKYSDHIEIMEMDYLLEEITVPAEIDGLPVTAFSAPIKNGMVGGITTNGCLRSITIPETVTSFSLAHCTALEEIILEGDNPAYIVSDGVLFSKDMTVLKQYPLGLSESSYTIPDSVQTIGPSAFSTCSLDSITNPEGVTTIDNSAFSHCEQLKDVVLPDSLSSLGEFAFERCSALPSITIPEGITAINRGTFMFCDNLKSVTFPDSLTLIDEVAFYWSGLTKLVLPEQLTTIGMNAFDYCGDLTTVSIPASVTVMDDHPFYECTALTKIAVDAENPAFCDVNGILMTKDQSTILNYPAGRTAKNYTIPNTVSTIDQFAFSHCTNLESVIIPETVTSIGAYAFSDCTNLQSAVILANCGTIANYTFSSNPKLSEIILSDAVRKVEHRAFMSTADMTEVYYLGSEAAWNSMNIDSQNEGLTEGNLHLNYVYTPVALGNLNDDALINASDAAAVLMAAANEGVTGVNDLTARQQAAADINTDGICNAVDAALILHYAAYTGSGGTESVTDWLNAIV